MHRYRNKTQTWTEQKQICHQLITSQKSTIQQPHIITLRINLIGISKELLSINQRN